MGAFDNAFDASGHFVGADPRDLLAGIQRRSLEQQITPVDAMPGATPAPLADGPTEAVVPPADNQFFSGLRRSVGSVGPELRSALGHAQTAMGYTDAGRANIARGQAALQEAEARDPSLSLADVRAGRGSVGDWLADKAGSLVPDVATLLIPGVGEGAVAGRVAASVGRRAVADLAEQGAAKMAARAGLAEATPEMTAAATRAAQRVAGPEVAASVKRASAAGQAVGTATGAFPGSVSGSNQDVLDAKTPQEAQERAQKALAGAAPQAALAAVVPSRFLAKLGGAPAAQAVEKTASAFLPGVAKAAAKEGALMAGLNMTQTAAALATHSWMQNHLDVVPPGAFMQYLESGATGFLFGAPFGVAGHVAKYRTALVDRAKQRVDDVRAKINEGLDKAKDAARTVVGEAPAAAPAESTPENLTATDMWRRKVDELAGRADEDVGQHLNDIEQRHNAFMESGEPELGMSRRSNPVQMPTSLQNLVMGFVPESSPLWLHDGTARAVAKSAEKLFTGEDISEQDGRHLAALSEAIGPDLVKRMAAYGPEWQRLTDLTQRVSKDSGFDPNQLTAQEEHAQTVQGLERHVAGMDPSHPDRPAAIAALEEAKARTPGSLIDPQNEARATQPAGSDHEASGLTEQDTAPKQTLQERVVAAEPGSPEHARAQADLRDALIGHRDEATDRPYKEMRAGEGKNNVIVGNSAAQVEKTLKRGFEIEAPEHNGKPVVVDVQNLVKKELTKPDYKSMDGDRALPALAAVMGDLRLAGVTVKPESIRPGVEIAPGRKLTPAEARMLRAEHDKVQAFQARAAEKAKAASEQVRTPLPARTPEEEAALAKTAAAKTVPDRQVEEAQGGEHDNRVDDGRLLERRAPPESPAPDSRPPGEQAKVVQGGGIEDVKIHGPHDKTVNEARAKVATARTKAEAAKARHEAGVKIGTAELKKHYAEGGPMLARKLRELNDYSSGKSREYLAKAAKGDFDSVKVTESRAENAEPKENAERVANERGTRATGATDPEHAAAREDSDIEVGFKSAKDPRGPHDHKAETKMVRAILDRLGVAHNGIKVVPLTDAAKLKAGTAGMYVPGAQPTVHVNPNFHGAHRIEVIAHEVGHHIIRNELGARFEKATPELRSALQADYDKWVAEQRAKGGSATVSDVLASRKAAFRADHVERRSTGLTVGELEKRSKDKADYLFDREEWLADHIARALTRHGESQTIIEKFFDGVGDLLRRAHEMFFRSGNEARFKEAPSVEKWVRGLFDRNVKDVSGVMGYSVPKETADAGVSAAVHLAHGGGNDGAPPRGPGGSSASPGGRGSSVLHEPGYAPFKEFIEKVLTADERGILERALYRMSVLKRINKRFGEDEVLQKAMENPKEEISALLYVGDKMLRDGSLTLGPKTTDVMLGIRTALFKILGVAGNNDYALKLFEDIHNGQLKATRDAGNTYDVRQRPNAATRNEQRQKAFNAGYAIYRDNVFIPWRQLMYGPEANAHLSYTPALRDVFSKFKLATGAVNSNASETTHGFVQDKMRQLQLFHTQMHKALNGLDKKQYEQLGAHLREQTVPTDPKLAAAHGQLLQLMRDAREYAGSAGLKLGDRGPNYWPVAMDAMQVKNRLGDFRKLLDQPHFKEFVDKAGGVDKLMELAQRTEGQAINDRDPLAPPDFRPMNPRVMQFIYDHGTDADKKAFASFQQQDLGGVLTDYLRALTNRAEYTRRAGADGEKLKAAFELAAKQGALPKDIEHAKDAIAAMTGAYAANGSPMVRAVFGDKAAKWVTSSKAKSFTDGMLAYQNVRNLALSTLSSIADVAGIGVRYGGIKGADDFHQSFKSFRDGLRAISGSAKGETLRHMAEIIGVADDYMGSHLLSDAYAPGIGGFAKKLSDAMFKYNGLNKWVRSTRYMALSAANAFLLKHAAGLDAKHSTRFLRELDVKASDIRRTKDGLVDINTGDAARDARVKAALNRFVDEAILRTDASQAPLYFNDPAMRLVTQYQQFAYAFESQILSRVIHEGHYGNFATVLPLLSYVPITLAAELAREFIQYGPGGNPNRSDWGWDDYSQFAAEKAGLLGPQIQWGLNKTGIGEANHYSTMHGLELGPTVQQAEEVGQTVFGHHSLSRTVVDALPGKALISHWSP